VVSASCGPAVRPPTEEVVELPSFTPAEAVLFDDQFDEAVFGRIAWYPTPKLTDRVRLADTVTVARIVTASEQPTADGGVLVVVECRTQSPALAGAAPEPTVRLTLAPNSPSHRFFRWQRPTLLGKDVVLFYRRYNQAGEEHVHFRAEPNTPAVHLAVQQALSAAPPPSP
jgi:hypothetical protein